ncbi:MAG: haloalkane dehalogenase [Eudoraea sp.]|nr:haloalkane dehalogenase [Eudoraea sp.]
MDEILRTPAERFENLPDYNFEENYLEVDKDLRMHYVDKGDKNNPVVLLLHGEPSWSYLYRKMIPVLSENGFRVIAPDLIGFGKSDKLRYQNSYSYQRHLEWMNSFIDQLDLKGITLFCQDWGGLIGLRIATAMPSRFFGIIASNTTLPVGIPAMPEAFLKWREFSQKSPDFDIGQVIDMGTVKELSAEIKAAYNAPFPTEDYKAGARIFPMLVPAEEGDPEAKKNKSAWQILSQWEKPFLTVFGDADPIMKGAEKAFIKLVPGARGQDHQILSAGHFIQEEQGETLAGIITAFYQNNTPQ